MPLETPADIAAYFDKSTGFSTEALYVGNNTSKKIDVILGEEYDGVTVNSGVQVETRGIETLVKTDDVPDIRHGDTLSIDGKVYSVINIRPDKDKTLTTLIISED